MLKPDPPLEEKLDPRLDAGPIGWCDDPERVLEPRLEPGTDPVLREPEAKLELEPEPKLELEPVLLELEPKLELKLVVLLELLPDVADGAEKPRKESTEEVEDNDDEAGGR